VRKLLPALQQSEGRSKPWGGAELVNAFAELSEGDKYDAFAIMALPGLSVFANISALPVRGVHRVIATLYAVIGTTLHSISAAGSPTSLGTVAGSGPVRMVDNGAEIAIHGGVNQDTGYVLSGGVLNTAIPNLPQVSDVAYIDGYFAWTVYQSDQFIISGLNAGLVYDPLDVATVEGAPDYLVGVVNDHRELHFPGVDTWEIWYNSGAADFPFTRQGNAFIERGCVDKNSLIKIDNSLHFVGDDLVIYRLNGYDPVRISTHAIEHRIAGAAWFRAFTYTIQGHKFYVLNTDVGSFAYDMATGAWAERKSFGRDNYRVSCACTAYGETILGDAYTGKLYTTSFDVDTEDSDPIPVIIEIPGLAKGRELATLYAFEVYCETGVGNTADPDPQIILQYSRDGGRQWSNELWRSLGAVGEYMTRAVWRLGVQFRQLKIRLQMPSKTRRLVISYFADIR
jgi:hypothetical protein